MSTTSRNEKAKNYIIDKLDLVSLLNDGDFHHIDNYSELEITLKELIFVKPMGFRGIVATAIVGLYLNPDYDPLNNFYGCHPRSIFEQGIFYGFEGRVPCGKSDPLNVAKNVNIINEDWAQGKRPQSAAMAAVKYLRFITSASGDKREDIINYFFFMLLKYSNSVAGIFIEMPDDVELSNQEIALKLSEFCLCYPESGTIPQLVISLILKNIYKNSEISVEGGDESVFGTNTTSKKPADIWLQHEGSPFSLFEVTVKKIDHKRLDDCLQTLNQQSYLGLPLNFICRILYVVRVFWTQGVKI